MSLINIVEQWIRDGASLRQIEEELDRMVCDEDERAALWLLAWARLSWRRESHNGHHVERLL